MDAPSIASWDVDQAEEAPKHCAAMSSNVMGGRPVSTDSPASKVMLQQVRKVAQITREVQTDPKKVDLACFCCSGAAPRARSTQTPPSVQCRSGPRVASARQASCMEALHVPMSCGQSCFVRTPGPNASQASVPPLPARTQAEGSTGLFAARPGSNKSQADLEASCAPLGERCVLIPTLAIVGDHWQRCSKSMANRSAQCRSSGSRLSSGLTPCSLPASIACVLFRISGCGHSCQFVDSIHRSCGRDLLGADTGLHSP